VKIGGHPCWRVEKALRDTGIAYELVPGPHARGKRDVIAAGTGQRKYPAIEFEDGSWYREESKDMERTICEGHLLEKASGSAPAGGGEETA
jgi:glutathione S-transferase-like protein